MESIQLTTTTTTTTIRLKTVITMYLFAPILYIYLINTLFTGSFIILEVNKINAYHFECLNITEFED